MHPPLSAPPSTYSKASDLCLGLGGALFFGLLCWTLLSPNALYQLTHGTLASSDVVHLFKYGVLGLFAAVGAAFVAARSARVATGEFLRLLWPGYFGLFVLISLFIPVGEKDTFGLLLLPATGLIIALFWQRYSELKSLNAGEVSTGCDKRWFAAAAGMALLYLCWFGYLSAARHTRTNTGLHDFGIYENLMFNTMQGRPGECGMFRLAAVGYEVHRYGNQFFSEHFIPTFWILTPFYAIWQSPYTLLIAQSLFIAAAAIPAYLIARKKLGHGAPAFLMTAALLLHPLLETANLSDMHIDTFVPFFLLGAFAAWLYQRTILYWVMLVLALGCKQEVSINVALMGVVMFFMDKDRRPIAVATFFAGILWYILTVQLLIPYFRDGQPLRQMNRYAGFVPEYVWGGDQELTAGTIVKGMVSNPGRTLGIILDPLRFRGLVMLLAPFGFFMIFTRWAWLWLLPLSAIHLLSDVPLQHGLQSYYGVTLLPAAFVGSVYGMEAFLARGGDLILRRSSVAAISASMIFVLFFTWHVYDFLPMGGAFRADAYKETRHDDLVDEYVASIPPDAVVTASNHLGAQLAARRFVYTYPEIVEEGEGGTEYLFLDTRREAWPLQENDPNFPGAVREFITSEEWGLVMPYTDGLLLFKRGAPDEHDIPVQEIDFTRYRKR